MMTHCGLAKNRCTKAQGFTEITAEGNNCNLQKTNKDKKLLDACKACGENSTKKSDEDAKSPTFIIVSTTADVRSSRYLTISHVSCRL
jgi:hypothetical protein